MLNFLLKGNVKMLKNMNVTTNPRRVLSSLGNSLCRISLPVYIIYSQLFYK